MSQVVEATTNGRSMTEDIQAVIDRYRSPGTQVRARIRGLAPGFLMHNALAMLKAEAFKEEAAKKGKRGKVIPTYAEESVWGLYAFDDGSLYLPSKNLHRSMIEAGKAFKLPKSRASMKAVVAAAVSAPIEYAETGFPLLDSDGKKITKYEEFVSRVVISRAAVMKARPLVREWEADAYFSVDEQAIPNMVVFADLLGYAGARIGVGDYRPEKSGPFGRFEITEFEVTE